MPNGSKLWRYRFRWFDKQQSYSIGVYVPDWIERQLAHVRRNRARASYNHAQLLPELRRMIQEWANYIDRLCDGVSV